MGAKRDLEAPGTMHRRDSLVHLQRAAGGAAAATSGARRRAALQLQRLGLGRAQHLMADTRWRLVALLLAGLMMHSMFSGGSQLSDRGLAGGVKVARLQALQGEGEGRSRSLVEQPPSVGTLSTLAAAAADLVAPLQQAGVGESASGDAFSTTLQPGKELPQEWIEGGTLGRWPKPYRDKKRQTVPNSIHQWKCTDDAINYTTQAAASATPMLQSSEWRRRHGDSVSLFKWCRAGLPEEVPQLQPVLKLESRKPRPERGLTVVTQLSLERFQMLDNQCSVWPYQISAVLYIPLLKGRIFSAEEPVWNKLSLDVGIAESIKFFERMEASNSSCILDLEVVVEERCERYAAMLYPTNALRNRALVNVNTEAMLLVDVDFAVSLNLADILRDERQYAHLMDMLHSRNAIVLPAFETQDDGEAGRQVALRAVREGKPFVVNKFQWNVVFGFHVPQYPQGHQPTDYWRWIKAHAAYPIKFSVGYEPYIMLHRDYVPFYDERFRGYYWNKVQHLMHISLQHGFSFLVHPTAFVVHVPHKKPSTKWLTRKMGQKEKNHQLFDNALFHMRQMDFVPVTSFPHLCTPEAAPVLPGEAEMRRVAAQRLMAVNAEAAAAAAMKSTTEAQATAAKRAAEAAAAAEWRAGRPAAAASAEKQRQETALAADAEFLAHQQHVQQTGAAPRQQPRARLAGGAPVSEESAAEAAAEDEAQAEAQEEAEARRQDARAAEALEEEVAEEEAEEGGLEGEAEEGGEEQGGAADEGEQQADDDGFALDDEQPAGAAAAAQAKRKAAQRRLLRP